MEVDQLRLIRIPHQSAELGYQDYVPGASTASHVLSAEQVVSVFPSMLLPGESEFMPVQMEVKEASTERGKITARVCLLGDDLKAYKVFALPNELL
jgi:anaphase-promoting complex subunit 4